MTQHVRHTGTHHNRPAAGRPVTGAAARLASLDAFRGFTMFWIVQGKGIIEGLRALGNNPVLAGITFELDHSAWQGLRYYDCIWPSFMLMVGVSFRLRS